MPPLFLQLVSKIPINQSRIGNQTFFQLEIQLKRMFSQIQRTPKSKRINSKISNNLLPLSST
jgi:hypothetical protein